MFQYDGFPNIYIPIIIRKNHLGLTKMVQQNYIYDADNVFENVNPVTSRLFLINAMK